MGNSLQAVKGMHDLLPDDLEKWQHVESSIRGLMRLYGYSEIRTPLVENTGLFSRAIGEVTDIVEKEMYTFQDRNGDSLSLRPEGTASCVRAGIEHGLFHNQQQRLWYMGSMFRHERPQKGRYRQFNQVGVETFGYSGPDIDLELVLMTARLWKLLGITGLRLEINSLGTAECRARYKTVLVDYFDNRRAMLDEDSLRRLENNPLRILDSKNPDMRAVIADAPLLTDYLDDESRAHFEYLVRGLELHGISYDINPRLVRGLDYYSRTVFEWTTEELGAQGAVCAGGRYDALVALLGGKETPAVGFAVGMERTVELMKNQEIAVPVTQPDVYITFAEDDAEMPGFRIAEDLRNDNFNIVVHCGGGSLKSQMKKADRCGARFAILLGQEELSSDSVTVKDMSGTIEQSSVSVKDLSKYLTRHLDNNTSG